MHAVRTTLSPRIDFSNLEKYLLEALEKLRPETFAKMGVVQTLLNSVMRTRGTIESKHQEVKWQSDASIVDNYRRERF